MVNDFSREDWIDRYKGMLILLVVAGHVVGGAVHFTGGVSQRFLHGLYLSIYSFHMPAFFFLAGLTWRDRDGETFAQFAIRKAKRLLVPYLVFGVISSVIFCIMSGSFASSFGAVATTDYYRGKCETSLAKCLWGLLHAGGLADGEGFRMNSVLWFLPCLYSTELCYRAIRRFALCLIIEIAIVLGCCLLAVVLPRVAPNLPWGFTKVPECMLFVILGAEVCRRIRLKPLVPRSFVAWLAVTVLIAGHIAASCLLPDPYHIAFNWLWWPVFALLAVEGCVVFACLSQLLGNRWLAACGGASMGIMLIHKFPVLFLEMKVPIVRRILGMGVAEAALGATVLVCVVTAASLAVTVLIMRIAPRALGEWKR